MSCQIKDYQQSTIKEAQFHFIHRPLLLIRCSQNLPGKLRECGVEGWREHDGGMKSEGRDKALTQWERDNYKDTARGELDVTVREWRGSDGG